MAMHTTGRRRTHTAGLWLTAAVFVIVGLAGLLKALDLPVFLDTVQTWSLLSGPVRWGVVFVLPLAEMILPIVWFAGIERRWLERAIAALLVGFAAAYSAHLALTEPPKCGCFGLVDEYFNGLAAGQAALWKNGALLGMLGTGWWLRRAQSPPGTARKQHAGARGARPVMEV